MFILLFFSAFHVGLPTLHHAWMFFRLFELNIISSHCPQTWSSIVDGPVIDPVVQTRYLEIILNSFSLSYRIPLYSLVRYNILLHFLLPPLHLYYLTLEFCWMDEFDSLWGTKKGMWVTQSQAGYGWLEGNPRLVFLNWVAVYIKSVSLIQTF